MNNSNVYKNKEIETDFLRKKIENALKKVIDPGTGEDVVSMGLIRNLEVFEGGKASLIFRPSVPTCPLAFKLAIDIKNAVKEIEDVNDVDLEVIDFAREDELNKMLKEREEDG